MSRFDLLPVFTTRGHKGTRRENLMILCALRGKQVLSQDPASAARVGGIVDRAHAAIPDQFASEALPLVAANLGQTIDLVP
jgi:hypothetical protein